MSHSWTLPKQTDRQRGKKEEESSSNSFIQPSLKKKIIKKHSRISRVDESMRCEDSVQHTNRQYIVPTDYIRGNNLIFGLKHAEGCANKRERSRAPVLAGDIRTGHSETCRKGLLRGVKEQTDHS